MKMTKFDKDVVKRTLNAVHSGLEFFYISESMEPGKFSIGSCNQDFYNKMVDEGTLITRATRENVENLLEDSAFLEDPARELMIESRAKEYLKEIAFPRKPYLKFVKEDEKLIHYRDEEIKTTWKISKTAHRLYRKTDHQGATQDMKFSDDFIRFEMESFLIEKSAAYRKRILKAGGWTVTFCSGRKEFLSLNS